MATNKKTTKMNKKVKSTQNRKEVLNSISNETSLSNIVKCVLIVLVIFVLMYFVTLLVLKRASLDYITKDNDKTSIQYSEILAGTSFLKKDSEYLVLFYDMSSDEKSTYENLYSDYKAKDEHLPIYYVDLSKSFNKSVLSDSSNKEAKNGEELKINGSTLIKFKDGSIDEYFEGEEEIKNYFNN